MTPYHVVALSETADLALIRKMMDVFCLEEAGGSLPAGRRDSAALLAHPLTRNYLKRLPDPKRLLLYQNYPDLEDLAKEEGWRLLANPSSLRLRLRQRTFFQEMTTDTGLPRIPGAIHPFQTLKERGYEAWCREFSPQFVIQLPEIAQGGGRGTFFIRTADAYQRLAARLKPGAWRGVPITSLFVRRFVEGTPASIALCVTRHGVLASGLQQQLIDLPYCMNALENGVFCGHVWNSLPWPDGVQEAALRQAHRIGQYVKDLGYQGIFGIDFIIEKRTSQVYALEINPRFTGAFPMLSLLHMQNGIIPLDIFHVLEFLDFDYQIDVDTLNRRYQRPFQGSHLLLFLPPRNTPRNRIPLRAGLFEIGAHGRDIRFIREGIGYQDIENEHQFIITDGPPVSGSGSETSTDSLARLCHLLLSYPAADNAGCLSPRTRRILKWIYKMADS